MKDVFLEPNLFQEVWDGWRVMAFLPVEVDALKENTVLIIHERHTRTMKLTGREIHATVQFPTLIRTVVNESFCAVQLKVYKKTSPEIVRMRAKEA